MGDLLPGEIIVTQKQVADAIEKLDEKDLTHGLLIPLIQCLHPGRTEYTHSPTEAGRDVVSFGKDLLGRPHLLLVQAKSGKISFGAEKFGGLYQTALVAREQGVTTESGQKLVPHEVWVTVPLPFPENERRQISDLLVQMERRSIKLIAGDELSCLIKDKIPEIASNYLPASARQTASFIAKLSQHSESRAFGLAQERKIGDFYVATHLAPHARLTRNALADQLGLNDFQEAMNVPREAVLPPNNEAWFSELASPIATYLKKNSRAKSLLRDYDVQVSFETLASPNDKMSERNRCKVHWKLASALRNELSTLRRSVRHCPQDLSTAPELVREVCIRFSRLERFLRLADIDLNSLVDLSPKSSANIDQRLAQLKQAKSGSEDESNEMPTDVRVSVSNPIDLLRLGNIVLVDGGPGCGKTTLLRTLGLSLLNSGRKIAFIFCHSIDPKFASKPLIEIVKAFEISGEFRDAVPAEAVLIFDGLDEAPFDLSDMIMSAASKFVSVVASARTAFDTELRDNCLHIGVAPFTSDDRRIFFEKWFSGNEKLIKKASSLVARFPDIDEHTRLPLVATILAALVEREHEPKTRAEIYGQRLDLLLEKWDKARGVQRLVVNEPDVKRRFIQQLAFNAHSRRNRGRTFRETEVEEAYETALGGRGYGLRFEQVMKDLVVGSGILIEERKGVFSFGHLSFQEHLAGEYLHRTKTASQLSVYLGNDWWNEPLNFWASIKGDITEFVEQLMDEEALESHAIQVAEMLGYAQFTSPGARDSTLDLAHWASRQTARD